MLSQFEDECRNTMWALSFYPDSFIVKYPKPRPNIARQWFLITHPDSRLSEILSDAVGEYLVSTGWIIPELDDKEYQMQIALGSIDCSTYKIAPEKKNGFKNGFKNDRKKKIP